MSRSLLLLTGAGRSGTSTAAGTFHHLGVHVPGPYLQANASNPRGFYESKWSVGFHNRILKRADVAITDGRPGASGILADAISGQDRARLRNWVDRVSEGHGLTLVKDPRTTWTLELWSDVTAELGIDVGFLMMLRHPAEVIGSRATHYGTGSGSMGESAYAVKNLAGWVNAMLMTEQKTRGCRRAFMRYDDLLSDWRAALTTAQSQLDIPLGVDASTREPHPVDEFIDPQLSRHRLKWSDVKVLPELEAVADRVWTACQRLADNGTTDSAALLELDSARARYAEMYLAAQHLTHDATQALVNEATRRASRQARQNQSAVQVSGREAARALLRAVRRRVSRG